MRHENQTNHPTDDQVAAAGRPRGAAAGPGGPAGLGYDPLSRNSNTFIGTIMRANGLSAPLRVTYAAVGYNRTFDAWTWWDLRLQRFIAQLAWRKLGGG